MKTENDKKYSILTRQNNALIEPLQLKNENQSKDNHKDNDWTSLWWDNREKAETERINNFREKQAKNNPPFSYKQSTSEDGKITLDIEKFDNPTLTKDQKSHIHGATLYAATGSSSEEFSRLILSQALTANFSNIYDAATIANAYNGALLSMAPQDEFEGMLCTRLLVLHNQQMHYMASAANPQQNDTGIDLNINRSTKLGRLWNETLAALNSHRRKGEQKVTVQHQHVNVNSGGQAIVGNINTGGGVNEKK